jgi:hypothetical protein
MSITGDNWEYRPVRHENGKIVVTEVYYNKSGNICGIETCTNIPYSNDLTHMTNIIRNYYPMIDTDNKKYNPNILDMIDEENLAGWDVDIGDVE